MGRGEGTTLLDALIRNGLIVDGSGKAGFKGDIGIEDGRIAFVQPTNGGGSATAAREQIDAAGKVVCPGFVDPHSHADLVLHRPDHEKLLAPLVLQGITTLVGGNCGLSMAPIAPAFPEPVKDYLNMFANVEFEHDCPWNTTGEFINVLESRGILLNAALLIPHGLIRIGCMGPERRYATDDEIRAMAAVVEQSMAEGAIGLSTGLQYFPGSNSDSRELLALGKALKPHDGIFASHLRSYSNTLPLAIDEVVGVARQNEIRAQISHIFQCPDFGIAGPFMRALIRAAAKMNFVPPLPLDGPLTKRIGQMMSARASGVCIGMDVMPTTTAFTYLLAFLPPWALIGTKQEILARLKDPSVRSRILHAIKHGKMKWPHVEGNSWSLNMIRLMGWQSVHIMAVSTPANKHYEGRALMDIARERKQHPLDTACELIVEEAGRVLVFFALAKPDDALTEASTFAPIKHPEISISTDTLITGLGKPSHLFHGCYPRFLGRYVREKKLLSLETAIRKMTSVPADHFKLIQRGQLQKGYHADIVVFDPHNISSKASFLHPDTPPEGICLVFINGSKIVDGGIVAQGRHGQVIRHN